jgi:hypothetical protein
MASFFALLQNNVRDRQNGTTRDELRLAIITWIERTYHHRRRQRALGKLTPSSTKPSSATTVSPKQHDPPQPPSTDVWADPDDLTLPAGPAAEPSAAADLTCG